MRPVDRVTMPRCDPLPDQVTNRAWCRQHWRRSVRSIGSPTGTPLAIVVEVLDRKGRRDRNQHRRGGGAEKQFVHDTVHLRRAK
jgi:hypothetical protein